MSTKAIPALETNNHAIERLFHESKEQNADLDRIAVKIARALLVRYELEEKLLYPAAYELGAATRNAALRKLANEGRRELALVREMLQRLSAARGKPDAIKRVLVVLEKAVMLHVTEEQHALLPLMRHSMDDSRMQRLAREMAEIAAHRQAA